MNTLYAWVLAAVMTLGVQRESVRVDRSPVVEDRDSIAHHLPDSVRMLVLSAFSPVSVEIVARGRMRVGGRVVRRARLEVSGEAELLVDGVAAPPALSIVAARTGDSVTLLLPQRRRSFASPLTVSARGGRLQMVVALPLRDYLAATLATETSIGDPPAYLTALAVVQRNFLLLHPDRHGPFADVCDNTHCQAANPERITARMRGAVTAAARIGLGDDEVRPAFYSACCGGGTLTPAQVWGTVVLGYTSVQCSNCRRSSRYRWENSIPATPDVERLLRTLPAPPFVSDDLRIGLGRIAGFNRVPGNTFERIVRRRGEYRIAGRGFGHRVGLCQEGARTLARNGWSAERILHYYFPSVPVSVRVEER